MSKALRFTKQPVTIEAMRMPRTPDLAAVREIAIWMSQNGYDANLDGSDLDDWYPTLVHNGLALPNHGVNFIAIETLEGKMVADLGDHVIRGVEGEFYPVKDSIFRKSYSLAVENGEGYADLDITEEHVLEAFSKALPTRLWVGNRLFVGPSADREGSEMTLKVWDSSEDIYLTIRATVITEATDERKQN